jgi:hypothetical protein
MRERTRAKRIANCVVLGMLSLGVTVAICEGLLRWRYAEPLRQPLDEVLAIQPYLKLHPEIGFTWNENIDAAENIVFTIQDAEQEALSTDARGFINPPDALQQRAQDSAVEVIGLGDSFMEHASHTFRKAFASAGYSYYNLAIHRQATPQYNAILNAYALPMNPKIIVYGLFENDFAEAEDFRNWKESGLDWFAFHSGTWCGKPLNPKASARLLNRFFPGSIAFAGVVRSRLRGDRMSILGPSEAQVSRIAEDIVEAHRQVVDHGARFLLVLIPSRATAVNGETLESNAYDGVLSRIADASIPVLDLRKPFLDQEDPLSLYYPIDAHWNRDGMTLAADAILTRLETNE